MAAASGDPRAAKAQGIVREVCRAVEGRVAPRRGGRAQAAGRGAPELRARPSRGRQGNRGSGRSVGTRASSPRRPRPRARHPEGTEPLGTPVRPEKRAPPGGQHRSPPSLTAPVWDSKPAVMERRGGRGDPGTGARGNSGFWTRPCARCWDCEPPRFPAELAGSERARRRGVPGKGGSRGCRGTRGGLGRRVGAQRGAPGRDPAGQAQGGLMLVLPERLRSRLLQGPNGRLKWGRGLGTAISGPNAAKAIDGLRNSTPLTS